MTKFFNLLFVLCSASFLHAQSPAQLHEILKLIPVSEFYLLNSSGLDSLISNEKYHVPGGDSLEAIQYEFQSSSNRCAALVMSFTTGQRAFIRHELITFPHLDGSILVFMSSYGGTAEIQQSALNFYKFIDHKLIPIKNEFTPIIQPPHKFMKASTPDSILKSISNHVFSYYSTDCQSNSIVFETSSAYFDFNWIEHDEIFYNWNGSEFIERSTP